MTPLFHRLLLLARFPTALCLKWALACLCACQPTFHDRLDFADDPDLPDGSDDPLHPTCALAPAPTDGATCPVTLRYVPQQAVGKVALAGEWNDWSTAAQVLSGPDGSGAYSLALALPPGVWAYKLVEDQTRWKFDPENPYRKYVGGVENSGLRVPDCHKPSLFVRPGTLSVSRLAPGQGELVAKLDVGSPAQAQTPGVCRIVSSIRRPDGVLPGPLPSLSAAELRLLPDRQSAELHLRDLPDGKYLLSLTPTAGGVTGETLLLPFWIEAEPFRFSDTPLYMAMTDRFVDGDSQNPGWQKDVRTEANFRGGDLSGVTAQIESGYFDKLGVRALWLSPFYTQPGTAHLDQSGKYGVTAYHGYWPIHPRQVDSRLGGDEALQKLVSAAHRHGIRVLADVVLNHVHEQHEYFQDPQKRSWFRTGCICGTAGCDWTEKRLSCLFASYMPDIDWTVHQASEQFISDTLYWLEHFDLDGLRVDAVKHVEDAAILNLTARVRERFEQAGTRYFLLGETAMGWRDGDVSHNQTEYDTIKRYMGRFGLDGQFDFVWHHANAYRVFAYDEKRFLHLDYWTRASLSQFGASTMVNYLGSHDTSRFLSLCTYRDPVAGSKWDRSVAYNKWDKLPEPPLDGQAYARQWLAALALYTLPGMPLLYYGDEYGEFGGGDPDNRHLFRMPAQRSPSETTQADRMQRLLSVRKDRRGLRRGPLVTALVAEDVYVYGRPDPDGEAKHGVLVVLNRLATPTTVEVPIPPELGFATGTVLTDLLTGQKLPEPVPETGKKLRVVVPAQGGLVAGL